MKATVSRNELNSALNIASTASSIRAALPVLTSLRLEAKDSGLTLTGCDGEMWGEAVAPANVETDGAVCVQQRLLSDIVGKLGDGDVSMELVGTTVFVRHDHSEFKLMALPAEEFPDAPDVEPTNSLSLPYGELMSAIDGVEYACSDDAARAVLTGVLFSYDGTTLTLVATDTHRLAVHRLHREGIGSPITAIVPNKALKIISQLRLDEDETLAISFDSTRLLVDIGGSRVVSQLLDGQYPNWERVVPPDHTRSWMINRNDFIANIDRAMILAKDSANRVRFTGQGESIVISARSEDKGEAKEEVSCVSRNGDLEIAFNGRYLMEALQAMNCEGIQAEMTESSRPAILRPTENGDDHFCVVMPMAIS
jgi:DNA polymerase-3 subunit beta